MNDERVIDKYDMKDGSVLSLMMKVVKSKLSFIREQSELLKNRDHSIKSLTDHNVCIKTENLQRERRESSLFLIEY